MGGGWNYICTGRVTVAILPYTLTVPKTLKFHCLERGITGLGGVFWRDLQKGERPAAPRHGVARFHFFVPFSLGNPPRLVCLRGLLLTAAGHISRAPVDVLDDECKQLTGKNGGFMAVS